MLPPKRRRKTRPRNRRPASGFAVFRCAGGLVFVALLAGLLAACGETESPGGSPSSAPPPRPESRLKPVAVLPFAFERPDAVLLVTGGTQGILEVCNCAGPMPGGLARRSGLVASYRLAFPDKTLLLDTGDLFWVEPEAVRNRFILKGYRAMGYDLVALGDQEWALANAPLGEILRQASQPGPTFLATTVRPKASLPTSQLPVVPEVTRKLATTKLTILNDLDEEAFQFFEKERRAELTLDKTDAPLIQRIAACKARGETVVLIAHGSEFRVETLAKTTQADLLLWGHTEKTNPKLLQLHGKPVVKVGSADEVGAIAMKINPAGAITAIDYRAELVDNHWPLDKHMLEIYQAYARAAMRAALDADRKTGLSFVPAKTCGKCHEAEYATWKRSRHARAWTTLVRVGRTGDPNCVTCHTLGFGYKTGFYTAKKTPTLAGVQCQSCHRINVAEHKNAKKTGFVIPKVTKAVCASCHTPVTDPRFKDNEKKRFHKINCARRKKK